MLSPETLDRLPDPVVFLYQRAEMDILRDMARRLSLVGEVTSTAEYELLRLEAMGATRESIMASLSRITGLTQEELLRLMVEAGMDDLEEDDAVYRAAGRDPPPLRESPRLMGVIDAGMQSTMGLFRNLTRTTASAGQHQLIDAMDKAWMQLSSGAFDQRRAVENAVREVAAAGLRAVEYPSGHHDSLDVAVRRAVLTGVNQTGLRMQDTRMDEMDCEHVEVSAHSGARNKGSGPENHAQWQGKVYLRNGRNDQYENFADATGYGTGEGLGGWNCRHHFHAFFPGISKRIYTKREFEKMDEKTIEYNEKLLSIYDATQQQRAIERQIRRWKRETEMLAAAGADASGARAKVGRWQAVQRDFIAQTGLTRQPDRERVIK